MADSEVTSVVKSSKERAASNADPILETRSEKSSTNYVHKLSEKWLKIKELLDPKKWPAMKEIVDPKGPFIPKWNVFFIASCVFAVLLDPLFLYIPIINEDMKCLRLDNNLKIAALVLRSVTDIFYMLNICFQVFGSKNCSTSRPGSCSSLVSNLRSIFRSTTKTMWRSYILIDILAVLPLPQVVILIFFSKVRGTGSFDTRQLMNFLVLVQYVPRVFRIYLSCKDFKKSSREQTPIWLKGLLNFFLYILASHVLGALWYFFAVQRLTTCWLYACQIGNGCDPNNFDCQDHHTLRNVTFLNDLCPLDPENAKLFDFGIFLDVLQFGILGSTNYPEKFSNCFWWGLRNLSSLGSNLQLSTNTWENLFAAFISILGLLLTLYLIGNLQTYMQLDTARIETHRWKMRIEKKMEKKGEEVELWLSKNGIPLQKKSEIMMKVLVEFKENKDVDEENILSILPLNLQNSIESYMPLSRLKQVSLLGKVDEGVLRAISEHLKPKKFTKNAIVIEEDKPLEIMLFIVDGHVIIEKRDCSSNFKRGARELYGEKLLIWPAWTSFPSVLPVATESVRAISDVQALVLMASDMKSIGSKFKSDLGKEITLLTDSQWELLTCDWESMLRKVPKLESMDRQVLKAISEHLKPMSYSYNDYNRNRYIISDDEPIHMMIFVIGGCLSLSTYYTAGGNYRYGGQFFGEELLDWVLDRSFPAVLPISAWRVEATESADVLILMAEDLASVVSKFRSHFSKEVTLPTDSATTDLSTLVRLTRLKNVPIFSSMDDQMLKVISEHLKPMSYSDNTYIIREHEPLEMMYIVVDGGTVCIESTDNVKTGYHGIGGFYGHELVHWVTNWASHDTTCFPAKLPLSTGAPKVQTEAENVEVFLLAANDLKSVVSKFRSHFLKQTTLPVDSEWKLQTFDPLTRLKQVPLLENMDEEVLKAIYKHLKPMTYSDTDSSPYIFHRHDQYIDKLIFIVGGLVCLQRTSEHPQDFLYSGNYYGERLLEFVSDTSFPDTLPRSDITVRAVGDVEVLVLMASDLAIVVSEFMPHFLALPIDSHITRQMSNSDIYW